MFIEKKEKKLTSHGMEMELLITDKYQDFILNLNYLVEIYLIKFGV